MATLFIPKADKSYKTHENAVKAVEKSGLEDGYHYMVVAGEDGRFRPVFFRYPKNEQPMVPCWAGFTVVG